MLRALALWCMFLAHCAPDAGPLRLFALSEFATAPLFALLIGIGAALGDRGGRGLPVAFVRAGVRAGVLVAVGLWVETWGAQVDIVLVYLALPTLIAPVLARLPTSGLLGLATAAWAAGPALMDWGRGRSARAAATGDELGRRLWDVIVAGPHYRFTTLLVFICLGIVVWRTAGATRSARGPAVAGVLALVAAATLLIAKTDGRIAFEPYAGTHLEVLFDVLLVGGLATLWLSLWPDALELPGLAVAGSMSLSVYVAQIVYLAWYVSAVHPGGSDDSWVNVVVLCAGSLVLPAAWRSLVPREPWSRGPIEGPTALVTRIIR